MDSRVLILVALTEFLNSDFSTFSFHVFSAILDAYIMLYASICSETELCLVRVDLAKGDFDGLTTMDLDEASFAICFLYGDKLLC